MGMKLRGADLLWYIILHQPPPSHFIFRRDEMTVNDDGNSDEFD
jgi:hypothetical protein